MTFATWIKWQNNGADFLQAKGSRSAQSVASIHHSETDNRRRIQMRWMYQLQADRWGLLSVTQQLGIVLDRFKTVAGRRLDLP
jgi:hypothetical protein